MDAAGSRNKDGVLVYLNIVVRIHLLEPLGISVDLPSAVFHGTASEHPLEGVPGLGDPFVVDITFYVIAVPAQYCVPHVGLHV